MSRRRGTTRNEAVLKRRFSTAKDRVLELEQAVSRAAEDLRLGEDASEIAGRLEELVEEPPSYASSTGSETGGEDEQ